MKKLLLLAAFALGLGSVAQAQSFSYGLTAGVNLSKMKVSDYQGSFKSDNRAGWFLGPKITFSLPIGIGIDAALEYSQRKLSGVGTMTGLVEGTTVHETYRTFEIPVNLRYSIGLGSLASVFVATGPQFGIALNDISWNTLGVEAKDDTRGFSTTWNVGAGVRLFKHLEVGLGYNFALGKMGKATAKTFGLSGTEKVPEWKSNTFQVHVAYYFK